jgi:hypothetical protein
MRRSILPLAAALVAAAAASTSAARAANTLCVGGKPGCYPTIQAAVNAAHDGDTILIAPGTFAGGVTIDVSVNLIGAGSNKTIIQGGGPVLTIGQQDAPNAPTVVIRGVTITGGLNNSVPDTVVSQGGGVWIPRAAGFTTGATVTIADSLISGNRVTPQTTVLPGDFCPGPLPCAFASGGGIDNSGTLTVTDTRISDNLSGGAGSVTLGATGGGIENQSPGTLVLRRSFVTGNRAVVTAPNGVFTRAGGIDNFGAATVADSVVSGNSVDTSNVSGAEAAAGGIDSDGSLVLSNSTVDHNHVSASLSSAADGFVLTDAGGIEVDGVATMTNTSIVANSASATAPAGTLVATGGGLLSDSVGGVTMRTSRIARNRIAATTAAGAVFVQGGGVTNFGLMTLEKTLVIGNVGSATAASGVVQGAGIWNSNFEGGPPTTPQLTLTDSAILANKLTASPGITPQGGGLFTTFPVMLTRTVIAGNQPDQCSGC